MNGMHKTERRRAYENFWVIGLEQEELLEVKYSLDRTGIKKKTAKKLYALECGPGCTSCICNNWTAGLTAVHHLLCILYKIDCLNVYCMIVNVQCQPFSRLLCLNIVCKLYMYSVIVMHMYTLLFTSVV